MRWATVDAFVASLLLVVASSACAEAELSFPAESGILAISRLEGQPTLTVVRSEVPLCGDERAQVEINARTDVAWFLSPVDSVAAEAIAGSCPGVAVGCGPEDEGCFALVSEDSHLFDAGAWPANDEVPEIRVPTACGSSFKVERTVELGLESPPVAVSSSGVIFASSGADVFRWDPPGYVRSGPRRVSGATELVAMSADDDERVWALSDSALYRQRGEGTFDADAFEVAEFDDVTVDAALEIDVSAAFTFGAGRQLGVSSGYIVVGTDRAIVFRVPTTPDADLEFNAPYRIRRIPGGIGVAALDEVWSNAGGEPLAASGLSEGAGTRRFVARSNSTVLGGHELGYRYRSAGAFSELVAVDLDGLVEVGSGGQDSIFAVTRLDGSLLLREAERAAATCVTRLPVACDEIDVATDRQRLFISCSKSGSTAVYVVAPVPRR